MENYEKIRVVGRGAYGTVHLCQRVNDKKLMIIKQIPVEQMTKEERQAALNEVKVLSMLDHPFIIEYHENFLEDHALMIVMEYAQGGTLFEYLQERNGNLLDEEEILFYLAQMVLAMQHVHTKQILHRDLKTHNILLDKKRQMIKISDFGISKVLSSKSKAYTVVGTPCYISPELCEGKPYNQKSDIWALGCVLYELASLKRAFEAANLPALVLKIMRGTVTPISDIYTEELRALILSTLHLEPHKRPHINQIIAQPVIINSIMSVHTDMGRIPSTSDGRYTDWNGDLITPVLTLESRKRFCQQKENKIAFLDCSVQVKEDVSIKTTPTGVSETNLPGAIDGSTSSYLPRYLEGQSAVAILHVACGDLFTACLTSRGILMTFGSGSTGCLGHGNYNDITQAKIVEALLGYEITQISCGPSHVLAVTNEHEVFAWGRGDNGRLGLGDQESTNCPSPVTIPDNLQPREVSCGFDCSMVLTLDNKLLSCGSNRHNKLALDEITSDGVTVKVTEEVHLLTSPASAPIGNIQILHASMGTSHSLVTTVEGKCYTFGSNQFGQLGVEPRVITRQPQLVTTVPPTGVSMLACGDTFSVVVTDVGEIYSWGKSERGRLGRSQQHANIPQKVVLPDIESCIVVSLSCSHGNTILSTKPIHGN